MSIEPPHGIAASAAGTHLAQSSAADVARARRAGGVPRRAAESETSDKTAGITAADGKDMQPNDRDPDGRQPWVLKRPGHSPTSGDTPAATTPHIGSGGQIDLVG